MPRKPIAQFVVDRVLLESRRRCCICFGLDRVTSLASGQIAHLDKNSANPAYDNLAFLCLRHHDEYDSTSSQRKNFTAGEVKQFRTELLQTLQQAFAQPLSFGAVTSPPADRIAGTYILLDEGDMSAEITIAALIPAPGEGLRYHVTGLAILNRNIELGAHIGTLDVIAEMAGGEIRIVHGETFDQPSVTTLRFQQSGQMTLEEVNVFGQYGRGVSFAGDYGRSAN